MTTSSDLNRETQMPHRVSLGDILASISLTPGEANTLLSKWADMFLGGAHHNLGRTLRDHATMVADPTTYGYVAPAPAEVTDQPEYTPPTAPVYARSFASDAPKANAPKQQTALTVGNDPRFDQAPSLAADDTRKNPSFTDIHGMPLTPDETRQYQHPQGGALDHLAMQQRDQRIAQLERELADARKSTQTPAADSATGFNVRSEATAPDEIA